MAIGERWKGFAELPPHIGAAVERLDPLFAREGVRLAYLFAAILLVLVTFPLAFVNVCPPDDRDESGERRRIEIVKLPRWRR